MKPCSKYKYLLCIVAMIIASSCIDLRRDKCHISIDKVEIPIETTLNLEEPSMTLDGELDCEFKYKTYQFFDFANIRGIGIAKDTPFVYVRTLANVVIVRLSNDINQPYVFTKHGNYWHCKRIESVKSNVVEIDRFVTNSTIYEYIQKIHPNGDVETIITECIYPNYTQIWYEERRYGLGTKLTKQESNPTLFQTLLSEREHFLQENKIRGCIDTILVGGKYFSTYDVIPNFDSTGVTKFLRYYNRGTGVFYNYNPKPIGLYNDFADSQRPDVIKRIK